MGLTDGAGLCQGESASGLATTDRGGGGLLTRSPLDETALSSERENVRGGRHLGCSVVCAMRRGFI